MEVRVYTVAFLLLLTGCLKMVYAGENEPGAKTYCVAKPSSDEVTLMNNFHYACSQHGVDCAVMQKGCPCFLPETSINHASIAMNLYYQAYGRNPWNCHFGGSGLIVYTNPSYGSCLYD